jgi:hypothetical protein
MRAVPASPFVFRIRRTPGEVILSGYLPDGETREAVLGVAKELFLMERVVDRARLADGAPRGFKAAALAGVGAVAQTVGGEAVLSGASMVLSGEVLYPQSAERIRRDAPAAAPRGWTVKTEVIVPGEGRLDKAACRRKVAEVLAREPVRFAEGVSLERRSFGVLDDLAEALRACSDAAIEVVGLPEGKAPAPERARAVRDQLIQAGLPEDRVGAAGEGPKPGEDLVPAGAVAIRWR